MTAQGEELSGAGYDAQWAMEKAVDALEQTSAAFRKASGFVGLQTPYDKALVYFTAAMKALPAIKARARERTFQEGLEAGLKQGYENGWADGHSRGWTDGQDNGIDKGIEIGAGRMRDWRR